MLMAKQEITNTWKLAKARFIGQRKTFYIALLIMGGIFLLNLIAPVWLAVSENDVPRLIQFTDYSIGIFVGICIGVLIVEFQYRKTNETVSVFPQTNTSRWLSSQMIGHFGIVLATLPILILYLLQYGLIWLLGLFTSDIVMLGRLDFGLLIFGYFAVLAYGFLIASVVSLTAALWRKFQLYAAAVLLILGGILAAEIYNGRGDVITRAVGSILGFFISEESLWLFFLKGIGVWLVLQMLAYIVNRFTVYHKYSKLNSNGWVTGVIFALIALLVTGFVGAAMIVTTSDLPEEVVNESTEATYNNRERTIELDTSHLPVGTEMTITSETVVANWEGLGYDNSMKMELQNESSQIITAESKKVYVKYWLPIYVENGIDMAELAQPALTARLEGNTIYLDYKIEKNIKAVVIPAWPFMEQFECYRNQDSLLRIGYTNAQGLGTVYVSTSE